MTIKRAVSVSLGGRKRDKRASLELDGCRVELERRGTDGDVEQARELFEGLDGEVDAFGFGGFELAVRVGDRRYPLRAGQRIVRNVHKTPVVDGSGLKNTLERRVFELAAAELGAQLRYRSALVIAGVDRFGLANAVAEVAERVIFADFHYGLGIPLAMRSVAAVRRMARLVMPVVGLMPIHWLYPTGDAQDQQRARFPGLWRDVDLVAGDFHYIRTNMPEDLRGRTIVTNTTTAADLELLAARGVERVITTTPRIDGRSFGTNMLEAGLTAWVGEGRALADSELDALIDRFGLGPTVVELGSR